MGEQMVRVNAATAWSAEGAGSVLLMIRAARVPEQRLLDEALVVDGARVEEGPSLREGARPVRLHADGGPVRVRYSATVAVDGDARICPRDDRPLPDASAVPFDLLEWTLPSRYAPSDALGPTAVSLFGDRPRTRALIPEVADWVRATIAYRPGASDSLTTAEETLLARQGVCRDLAHLATALLRALDVPARLVAAYAPLLEPPDFHAVVEAYDGEAWRIVDATGLAPVGSLVRIATGRDAADIAWASAGDALTLGDVAVHARTLEA